MARPLTLEPLDLNNGTFTEAERQNIIEWRQSQQVLWHPELVEERPEDRIAFKHIFVDFSCADPEFGAEEPIFVEITELMKELREKKLFMTGTIWSSHRRTAVNDEDIRYYEPQLGEFIVSKFTRVNALRRAIQECFRALCDELIGIDILDLKMARVKLRDLFLIWSIVRRESRFWDGSPKGMKSWDGSQKWSKMYAERIVNMISYLPSVGLHHEAFGLYRDLILHWNGNLKQFVRDSDHELSNALMEMTLDLWRKDRMFVESQPLEEIRSKLDACGVVRYCNMLEDIKTLERSNILRHILANLFPMEIAEMVLDFANAEHYRLFSKGLEYLYGDDKKLNPFVYCFSTVCDDDGVPWNASEYDRCHRGRDMHRLTCPNAVTGIGSFNQSGESMTSYWHSKLRGFAHTHQAWTDPQQRTPLRHFICRYTQEECTGHFENRDWILDKDEWISMMGSDDMHSHSFPHSSDGSEENEHLDVASRPSDDDPESEDQQDSDPEYHEDVN